MDGTHTISTAGATRGLRSGDTVLVTRTLPEGPLMVSGRDRQRGASSQEAGPPVCVTAGGS